MLTLLALLHWVSRIPVSAAELLSHALAWLFQKLLILSIMFSFAYRWGWFHRVVWSMMEERFSAILNDTTVTIGSFDWDVFRGRMQISNLIVHAPCKEGYRWESPVLVRIGRIDVSFNLLTVVFSKLLLQENTPLDIPTMRVSDIQVFLERKNQIFNVYLVDPLYVIPPNTEPLNDEVESIDELELNPSTTLTPDAYDPNEVPPDDSNNNNNNTTTTTNNNNNTTTINNTKTTGAPAAVVDKDEERAEKLVDEMIRAIQSLGRAAQEGSLPQALVEQRQRLTNQLKSMSHKNNAFKESVEWVSNVSRALLMVSQPSVLPKPPNRRAREENVEPVYARFGRVLIVDLRVFTRTNQVGGFHHDHHQDDSTLVWGNNTAAAAFKMESVSTPTNAATATMATTTTTNTTVMDEHGVTTLSATTDQLATAASEVETRFATNAEVDGLGGDAVVPMVDKQGTTSPRKSKGARASSSRSYWNKPITVERMWVRPSELSPPLSTTDEQGEPLVFPTIDKSMEAILQRILSEMAKSNTGRLFRTAMGEVLEYWVEKEYRDKQQL